MHGAAQAPRRHAALAMAPEHRQVRTELLRERDDAIRRMALLEPDVHDPPERPRRLALQSLEVATSFLSSDLPVERIDARFRVLERVHHVHQGNVAAKCSCERNRIAQADIAEP